MLMGIVTSLFAAVIPARAAASVDPVKALQKGRNQVMGEGESRARRWAALACAAASAIALIFSRNTVIFYAGFVLSGITAVLLAPSLTLWLSRILRPMLAWVRPVEGTLAADSLIQGPRRTSGTVAALMLSLALVISLGGLARSSYDSLSEWMRLALNPDLFVTTAQNLTARDFVFPGSLGEKLRAVPGVAEVQAVRSARVAVKGGRVMLVAFDVSSFERGAKLPPVEGDQADMYRRTNSGEALMASENFVRLHGGRLGEIIEIPAPGGTLRLPIAGIVRDFSDQQGSLRILRDAYIRAWHDDSVNVFRLYLARGANSAEVRQRILDAFGKHQRLFVLTNQDVLDDVA